MNKERKKKNGAERREANIDDETYLQKKVAERIADDKYSKELPYNIRGQYIISQALYYAIQVMKEKPYPELSNIADMMVLRQTVFPFLFGEEWSENRQKEMSEP
jgi:hypothetical protein